MQTIKTKWLEGELSQNTFVIETDNGLILIDAGCPPNKIKELSNKPVLAIFLTHGHFDHVAHIEEYGDIPIYASEKIDQVLTDETENVSAIFSQPRKYKVNNIHHLKDNEIVKIDDLEIKAISTPGHSRDGMCFLINNDLYSGDAIFSVAMGRIDLPGSNIKQMIESLNKLNRIDFNNLYAGHGRVSNKQEQIQNIAHWLNELKNISNIL